MFNDQQRWTLLGQRGKNHVVAHFFFSPCRRFVCSAGRNQACFSGVKSERGFKHANDTLVKLLGNRPKIPVRWKETVLTFFFFFYWSIKTDIFIVFVCLILWFKKSKKLDSFSFELMSIKNVTSISSHHIIFLIKDFRPNIILEVLYKTSPNK